MPDYFVSSTDFCTQGFERLRCNNEILLLAYPTARQGANAICQEILQDLQASDHGEGFNYKAARKAIRLHFKALAVQWKGANALSIFGRDAFTKDHENGESCAFYVYLSTPESACA